MANVYYDRKMMKWLPFQALPEQGAYLDALYHARNHLAKPILSDDQYSLLNRHVHDAYCSKAPIMLKYYRCGAIHSARGRIIGIDRTARILMLDALSIDFDAVLEIIKN